MAIFAAAAALLSLERLAYIWIWQRPDQLRALAASGVPWLRGDPVDTVRRLFLAFKVVQIGVFAWWCRSFGGGQLWPVHVSPLAVLAGGALIGAGQLLNAGVFYRLGGTGVFYGSRFGHAIPWSHAFPFSWLKHPQYVGTVLSIWGFFLIMRFPHQDWCVLPLLETAYYTAGVRFEQ